MHAPESQLLKSISGITHAFGTAAEPVSERWRDSWEASKPSWKQVHGVAQARVTVPKQNCGEVDSLWSSADHQWVGIATADCVPILIAERSGRAVAAIHAGWRGTLAKAIKPVLLAMEREGFSGDDLVAAIGPSIRSCCFEVGLDLVENFMTEFPQIPEDQLSPQHRHIDLVSVNETLLRGFGIQEIDVLPYCTKCYRDESGAFSFQSYRRDGGGTRQYSIIARTIR